MRALMNIIPLAFLSLFLLFIAGWQLFSWSLTALLPYVISSLFLCIASLNWNCCKSGKIKKINAVFLIFTIVLCFGLIFSILDFKSIWEILIYSSIIGTQLLFINLNERSKISTPLAINYLGLLLVSSSLVISLFDINTLILGYIGLTISLLLTSFHLVKGFRK